MDGVDDCLLVHSAFITSGKLGLIKSPLVNAHF